MHAKTIPAKTIVDADAMFLYRVLRAQHQKVHKNFTFIVKHKWTGLDRVVSKLTVSVN